MLITYSRLANNVFCFHSLNSGFLFNESLHCACEENVREKKSFYYPFPLTLHSIPIFMYVNQGSINSRVGPGPGGTGAPILNRL